MSTRAVAFDEGSAKRIVDAVRKVEGMKPARPEAVSQRSLTDWFWARISGAYDDETGYPFTALLPDGSGGWDDDTFTGTRLFDASGCKHFLPDTVLEVFPQGYNSSGNPLFQCRAYTPGDVFSVNLSSPSAATSASAISYVVKNQDDSKTLADSSHKVAPETPRPFAGTWTAATTGLAYYDEAGVLHLWRAFETHPVVTRRLVKTVTWIENSTTECGGTVEAPYTGIKVVFEDVVVLAYEAVVDPHCIEFYDCQ